MSRRLRLLGAAACAAVLAGCVTAPGLGPNETRVAVDTTTAPWRSLGLVATDVGGRCTGALVTPRVVLTAAHCLFDPRTAERVDAGRVRFFLAIVPAGNMGQARATGLILGAGFRVLPGLRPDRTAPADADWAMLILDAPVGSPALALPLAAGMPPPGTPLAYGGYQADRRGGMVADIACAVSGYGRDAAGHVMMRHSCAATQGASGGPLLAHDSNGRWVVVGVGSMAQNDTLGGWAVPTRAIFRTVQAAATTVPSSGPVQTVP